MGEQTKTPPDEAARLMVVNWFAWMSDNDQWCEIKVIEPSKRTPHRQYQLTHFPDKANKRNKTVIKFAVSETPVMIRDFAKVCSWRMADTEAFQKFDPYKGIVR